MSSIAISSGRFVWILTLRISGVGISISIDDVLSHVMYFAGMSVWTALLSFVVVILIIVV